MVAARSVAVLGVVAAFVPRDAVAKRGGMYMLENKPLPGSTGLFLATYQGSDGRQSDGPKYTVKVGAGYSLATERDIMAIVQSSREDYTANVMQSLDGADATASMCVALREDGTCRMPEIVSDIIVMPYYQRNLRDWLQQATSAMKITCQERVMRTIRQGMDCIHNSKIAHLGLTSNYVMFNSLDRDSCPENVVIAGLSTALRYGSVLDQSLAEGTKETAVREFYDTPSYDDAWWGTGKVTVSGWLDGNSMEVIELVGFQGQEKLYTALSRRPAQTLMDNFKPRSQPLDLAAVNKYLDQVDESLNRPSGGAAGSLLGRRRW